MQRRTGSPVDVPDAPPSRAHPCPLTVTPVISPDLYQIDPSTGRGTLIAPTTLTPGAVVQVNGIFHAFDNMSSQEVSLDLANGQTSVLYNFDPAAGLIGGGSPDAPEPASMTLAGIGIAAMVVWKRRKRASMS